MSPRCLRNQFERILECHQVALGIRMEMTVMLMRSANKPQKTPSRKSSAVSPSCIAMSFSSYSIRRNREKRR